MISSPAEREPGCDDDDETPISLPPQSQSHINKNLLGLPRPGDSLTDSALVYAVEFGWKVFPCCEKPGNHEKTPLIKNGFKGASNDPKQIKEWWGRFPSALIGWPLFENLIAIDEDPRHGGDASRVALEHKYGPLPTTLRQITGGHGQHWVYTYPSGIKLKQIASGELGIGIDTRIGGRGYVIIPPSVHPRTKSPYRWHTVIEPVPAPDWLIELLTKLSPEQNRSPVSANAPAPSIQHQRWAEAALANIFKEVSSAPEGSRNQILNNSAFRVGQLVAGGLLDEAWALETLRMAGKRSGLSETEVNSVLR